MSKSDSPKTSTPKTARQRKADFDQRMKNRGAVDSGSPERWAFVFYLTRESRDLLKRFRDENRFVGTDAQTNGALLDEMLRVYAAWRQNGGSQPPCVESATSPPAENGPPLSAQLRAFRESLVRLEAALGEKELRLDLLKQAHEAERWTRFDAMLTRVLETSARVADNARVRWEVQWEIEQYLDDLIFLCEEAEVRGIQTPSGRGHLFDRVLRKLRL